MTEKLYKVKANEQLFNSWLKHGNEFLAIAAIVQNDMDLSETDLNTWYVNTNHVFKNRKEASKPGQIHILIELRNQTIQYIKKINKE